MNARDYEIPWTPPDLAPGISLLLGARKAKAENRRAEENAKTQRMYADAQLRRANSQEARDQAEHQLKLDEMKRKKAADTAAALEHAGELLRSGDTGVGQGYAKQFGIDIAAKPEPPQPTDMERGIGDAARLTVASSGNPLLAAVTQPQPQPQRDQPAPVEAAPPVYEGPDIQASTGEQAQQFPTNMIQAEGLTFGPEDIPKPEAPAEPPGPVVNPLLAAFSTPPSVAGASSRPSYQATVGGQTYDLGGSEPQTTGLGPKYDALYQSFLSLPGGKNHKEAAFAKAFQAYKDDQSQEAAAQRTADLIGGRKDQASAHEQFLRDMANRYQLTAEDKKKLAEMGIHAREVSAGLPFKQEGVNDRVYSLLDRRAAEIRRMGQFQKLASADQNTRALFENIAENTNALQHKDAQIQLARIFRQAQPTEGEMHMLYNNLGGTMDKWNQFVARLESGDLSAEQMRQLRQSAVAVKREGEINKKRFVDAARRGLGPGSGLDMIPDQAQKQFEMMAVELGIDPGTLPPLYSTEGGVTLGSKQAPSVHSRKGPAAGIPYNSTPMTGKVGPHGRPVWRSPDGKLHEQDE